MTTDATATRVTTDTNPAAADFAAAVQGAKRPYDRSWVNALLDGIDGLPGPTWAAYLAISAIFLPLTVVQAWVSGIAPVGEVDPQQAFWGVFMPLTLWLFHYLDGVARGALQAFRPALGASDADVERLGYELTVIPARPALAILVLSALITPPVYIADPVASDIVGLTPIGLALRYASEVFFGSVVFTLIYHSFRQMRAVGRTHAQATRVDLFHPGPLYAFANLTARTGIIVLFVSVVPLAATPAMLEAGAAWIWVPFIGTGVTMAVAVFVLPLRGMHARLVAEKDGLQYDSEERLKSILAELDRDVDAVNLVRADGLNKTLGSLLQQREVLARLPTWPWSPGTVRGFVTVILLPVILFITQRYLLAFVGLN